MLYANVVPERARLERPAPGVSRALLRRRIVRAATPNVSPVKRRHLVPSPNGTMTQLGNEGRRWAKARKLDQCRVIHVHRP